MDGQEEHFAPTDFSHRFIDRAFDVRTQHSHIEKLIRDKENERYHVRCLIGKYYPQTGAHDAIGGYLAVFARHKRQKE